MQRVGSGLSGYDDLPTGLASVLGGIGAGEHSEFLDRVQHRSMQRLVAGLVVVVDAIKNVLRRDFVAPRDVHAAAKPDSRTLSGRGYTWLQERQLQITAAIERKFDDLLLIDYIANRGAFG